MLQPARDIGSEWLYAAFGGLARGERIFGGLGAGCERVGISLIGDNNFLAVYLRKSKQRFFVSCLAVRTREMRVEFPELFGDKTFYFNFTVADNFQSGGLHTPCREAP